MKIEYLTLKDLDKLRRLVRVLRMHKMSVPIECSCSNSEMIAEIHGLGHLLPNKETPWLTTTIWKQLN